MRKSVYIFFMMTVLANNLFGQNNIMLDKANQLYHNKQYKEAADLYLQMVNDGYEHPALFYNLGNASYRQNQIGIAIWGYKKAMQLEKNKNLKENLALAERRIKEPIPEIKNIFFVRWWQSLYNLFSVNVWAFIALASFILAFGFLFYKKWKGALLNIKPYVSLSIILSIFSLILMCAKTFEKPVGIIIGKDAYFITSAKAEPILISEGIQVRYLGKGKTGINISLPDGREGSINADNFKKL